MEICIFQINFDRDLDHRFLLNSKLQEIRFGNFYTPSNIYDLVFKGYVDAASLEDIFEIFNLDIPFDYKARNMATSDIIWVIDGGAYPNIEPGFYFVDGYGFKKIEFNPSGAYDATKNHANILRDGGNYHRPTMED